MTLQPCRRPDCWNILPTAKPESSVIQGYIGCADITPVRKPPGGTLTEHDKTYNRSVNHIRWAIEAVIAHLKGFKCLAHRYRRPYPTFRTTLSTIIGLFFFKRYE